MAVGTQAFAVNTPIRETLTPREAAAHLKRSVVTLERWRRLRIGPPYFRVCGRVLYDAVDIGRWLEEQKQATERSRAAA
jgi:hypothetical protein